MRIKKAINESKQVGILYHICTLDALAKYIAPNDTLSGSGKYTNYILNSNQVVSFTRDRNYVVNTGRNRISPFLFRFSVNGDKLSEKYKLSPYNDLAFKSGGKEKSNFDFKELEKEEVLLGEVRNFSKYVIQVEYSVNENIFESSISELQNKIIPDYNASIKYLSSLNTIYSKNLRLNESNLPPFSSLNECGDFLNYLLGLYSCTASVEEVNTLLQMLRDENIINSLYEGFFSGLYSSIAEKGIKYLPIFYNYGVEPDILIEDYTLAFPELEEDLKETMSSVMSTQEIERFF
jgi:hypothetical protein